MTRGIHQFVPMLHRHDAVGEHTRSLRDRLLASGIPSHIYSEVPDPATVAETRPYRSYAEHAEPGDILVYQFATASSMASWLCERPEPLVLNYHSVTPPQFFEPWSNPIARLQVATLGELPMIASRADLGIADSRFDESELLRAGCQHTMVVPLANIDEPPVQPAAGTLKRLEAEQAARRSQATPAPSWLSVGRLVPNKAHHHTVAALFVARMTTDPGAHLTLVGSPAEVAYARALRRYVAELGLEASVDFVTGIDDAELAAYYRGSDLLVMLSEHEGFGVPLVEAMGHGLPILAFEAGAVPEVLGDAGDLLSRKYPGQVADAAHRLLADRPRREAMVRRGLARFAALGLGTAGARLVEAIRGVGRSTAEPD